MTPLLFTFQNNIILSVQFKPTIRNIYAHKNLQSFSEKLFLNFHKTHLNPVITTKTEQKNSRMKKHCYFNIKTH